MSKDKIKSEIEANKFIEERAKDKGVTVNDIIKEIRAADRQAFLLEMLEIEKKLKQIIQIEFKYKCGLPGETESSETARQALERCEKFRKKITQEGESDV